MTLTVLLLLGSALLIYLSCEYFVNGVEWVGRRFGVARSSVGTILAAFGTALPESVVTFIAVVLGKTPEQKDIGVGAALGGPLVLATISYAVVGIVFLLYRRDRTSLAAAINGARLAQAQGWFTAIFVFKIALGLIAFAYKPWLGLLFFAAYGVYVWREMRDPDLAQPDDAQAEPLKLRPGDAVPSTFWAVTQTAAALVVIFLSSQLFVHQLEATGTWLGMSAQLVALLLSPIATELPETLNAVIWVRQGKTALAMGNISGAMMIQATVPSALGLLFTPWLLDTSLVWAAAVTMIAIAGLFWLLRRERLTAARLACFGLLYIVFACGLAVVAR
ncbi:MAG: sodium:calcium antiporter [Betaproteobacteria bacterium]